MLSETSPVSLSQLILATPSLVWSLNLKTGAKLTHVALLPLNVNVILALLTTGYYY